MRVTLAIVIVAVVGYLAGYAAPKLAICESGTEQDIRQPGEYPVWSMECRNALNVRVVVVD